MKKKFKILSLFMIVIAVFLGLVSCTSNKGEDPNETTTTNNNGGATTSEIEVIGQWQYDENNHYKVDKETNEIVISKPHEFIITFETTGDCMHQGTIHYQCTVCGYEKDEIGKYGDHKYEGGMYQYIDDETCAPICDLCGEVGEPLAHEFNYTGEQQIASCEHGIINHYICRHCGYDKWEEVSEPLNHSYYVYEIETKPTLDSKGTLELKCYTCESRVYVDLPNLQSWTEECQVTPSCIQKGEYRYTYDLTLDEYDIYEQQIEFIIEGDYGEHECITWQNDILPTYDTDGRIVSYCSICGEPTYHTLPKVSDGECKFIIQYEPTCTNDGQGYAIYEHEGFSFQYGGIQIPALGHNYITEVCEPTCVEGGFTYHYCDRCGLNYKDEFVGKTGHNFGDVVILKDGTCTNQGVCTHECLYCGLVETLYTPKLAHEFVNGVCVSCGYSYDITSDLLFELSDTGDYYIVVGINRENVDGSVIDLVIPSTYDGPEGTLPVKEIADGAFYNIDLGYTDDDGTIIQGTTINSITILEGIEKIGQQSFRELGNIESIELPMSLLEIGSLAFNGTNAKKISLGGKLNKIGSYAFANTSQLSTIYINSTIDDFFNMDVATAGLFATTADIYFSDEKTDILYISGNISEIKPYILASAKIKEVVISASQVKISQYAFMNSQIEKITIDDASVLENNALAYMYNLNDLYIYGSITQISFDVFGEETYNVKRLILPRSLESIQKGTLKNFSKLAELTIPFIGIEKYDVETSIEDVNLGVLFTDSNKSYSTSNYYSYEIRTNVKYYIPKTLYALTVDGGNIFTDSIIGCIGIKFLTLGDYVEYFNTWDLPEFRSLVALRFTKHTIFTFLQSNFTTYSIPVVEIVYEGGYNIDTSHNVIRSIDDSKIKIIDDFIFFDNTNANHSIFDYNGYLLVGYIGTNTNLILPDYGFNYGVGYEAFSDLFYETVTIPDCVDYLDKYSFSNLSNLTSVTIGAGIKEINYAFRDDDNLSNIKLGENIEYIKDSFNKVKINELDFTEYTNLKVIDNSFNICITYLYLANTIEKINNAVIQADYVYFEGSLEEYFSIFGNDGGVSPDKELYIDGTLLENLIIPEGTTVIPNYAFSCESIKSVVLNDGLIEIGTSAFAGSSIKELIIPDTVKKICDYAFVDTLLVTVTIPASVEEIGEGVFSGSVRLVEIVNLSNVETNLGWLDEFEVVKESKLINIDDYIFINKDNIYYLVDYIGKDTILNLPETDFVYIIRSYAIYDMGEINIHISNSVQEIMNYGFFENTIVGFSFADDSIIETIPGYLFQDNVCNFTSLIFPASMKYVSAYSIYGLSLDKLVLPKGCESDGIDIRDIKHLEAPIEAVDGLNDSVVEYLKLYIDEPKDLGYAYTNFIASDYLTYLELVGDVNVLSSFQIDAPKLETFIWPTTCTEIIDFNFTMALEELVLSENLEIINNSFNGITINTLVINENLTTIKSSFSNCKINQIDFTANSKINDISGSFANSELGDFDLTQFDLTQYENAFSNSTINSLKTSSDYLNSIMPLNVGYLEIVGGDVPRLRFNIDKLVLNNVLSFKDRYLPDDSSNRLTHLEIKGTNPLELPNNFTDFSILETLILTEYVTITNGSIEVPELKYLTCTTTQLDVIQGYSKVIEVNIIAGKILKDNAFYEMSSLINVSLPDELEVIGISAFYGTSLTSIVLPSELREIGSSAFMGITEITSVALPEKLETIGVLAFRLTSISEIYIPSSVTYIRSNFVPNDAIVTFEDIEGWYRYNLEDSKIDGSISNPTLASELFEYNDTLVYYLKKDII